jgi:hypothetical protein
MRGKVEPRAAGKEEKEGSLRLVFDVPLAGEVDIMAT